MADALIIEAVRTPVARRGGAYADLHPADLLAQALAALLERTGLDPDRVDDVLCGCVTQVGEQLTNVGRTAWLAAGMPEAVPATTIDRQCGSSQQAVHFAAQAVMSGTCDVVVACGIENMTRVPMGSNTVGGDPESPGLRTRYGNRLVPQGQAAELVVQRFGLGREEMDRYAIRSHERAIAARGSGAFAREIASVMIDGRDRPVTEDEGPREPNPEKIATLRPAFTADGAITAASSSQISDGAGAVMVVSPRAADTLGLTPRARIRALAVVGDDPVEMLTAPIPATERVLTRAGLRLTDIDLVEINEAFACVPLAWQRALRIEETWFADHVNVRGGSIALGHPLGASGVRLLTTLLHGLEDTGGTLGLQTMCELGGLANALVIERLSGGAT